MNIVTGEVGIDVSKAFLDVCIGDGKPFRVPYTEADCKELIRRLPKGSVVHLESSGGYERVVRTTLRTAGFDVKTHDPLKVRRHAQSQARKGKTDALDAKHLAANGSKIPSQQEKSLTREGLCDLSRAIDSLKGNIAKLRTQARAPGLDPYVQSQLLACAKSLATHVKAMEKEFGQRVKASDLKDKHTTAQTVPGCGPCLARVLVSELPENLGEFTLNQVSSYSAIAPIDDESGQTKKTRSYPAWERPNQSGVVYAGHCLHQRAEVG